jgi:large subunit ribosomal protein L3
MAKKIKKAVIVRKVGMTSYFDKDNNVLPVTVLEGIDLAVIKRLTKKVNGYSAVQIAYNPVKKDKLNKPEQGVFDKAELPTYKSVKELRMDEDYLDQFSFDPLNAEDESSSKKILDVLNIAAFQDETKVYLQGKNKGKGFSGTIKAHHFSRGPVSHGSKSTRLPGSIGAGTDPSRVFKGKRMAKNLGNDVTSVVNYIVNLDMEKNLVFVKGAVPGRKGTELLLYSC